MTVTRALMGGILKILSWVYLSAAVTGDKYCIFGRVEGA